MLDKSKRDFEEIVLKNSPEAIKTVKDELLPLLNEKLESESVVKDTVSLLDTDVINQAAIQDGLNNLGQGNTNDKVRVRTMDGPSPFATMSSTTPASDENNYSYPQYNGTSDDTSNWRSGFTDSLILLGTGFLVLLVFVVSYLMLNYFG